MLSQCNKADTYIREVCEQIRWKKAHAMIEEELLAHIEDQKEAFMADGIPDTEAEKRAVAEMGSPVETGSRFDRLYRPHLEWSVLLFVGVLLVLGTGIRFALLSAMGEELYVVQTLWTLPVGLAMLLLGYWLDYTALLAGSKLKIGTVLFAYLGVYSVLTLRSISLGPVENGVWAVESYLALFFPPFFCALLYVQKGRKLNGVFTVLWDIILFANMFMWGKRGALLLLLGSGMLSLLYALRQNWFACKRWLGLLVTALSAAVVILLYQFTFWHRLMEVAWFNLNPYVDAEVVAATAGQVHTVVQGASWIGSGSVDLAALAENIPHFSTDYLLTAMLNQWGWCVIILVLLAYVVLTLICCFACSKVKSVFGKIVTITILSSWMMQVILYTLTNLTTIQMNTYPLLFVQGDVELVCNLFLLGLLLSVYKTGAVETDDVLTARINRNKEKVSSFWSAFWGNTARLFTKGMDHLYNLKMNEDGDKIKK